MRTGTIARIGEIAAGRLDEMRPRKVLEGGNRGEGMARLKAWMDRVYDDKRLGWPAVAVAMRLARMADYETGLAWCAVEATEEGMKDLTAGRGRRTVFAGLKQLRERGHITPGARADHPNPPHSRRIRIWRLRHWD